MVSVMRIKMFVLLGVVGALNAATVSSEEVTYLISDFTPIDLVGDVTGANVSGTIVWEQSDPNEVTNTDSFSSAALELTINDQVTAVDTTSYRMGPLDTNTYIITNSGLDESPFFAIDWQRLNASPVTGVTIGRCRSGVSGACQRFLDYARGSVSAERVIAQKVTNEENKQHFRPNQYTTAPDVRPANYPTCGGKVWVTGFRIGYRKNSRLFIEHKHKDSCFDEDVIFLPEGLRAYDRPSVTAFLNQPIDYFYWQ